MKKQRIYIAGKITGLDWYEAFAMFDVAEADLRARGFEPLNPMKKNGLDGDGEDHPWAEYMKRDIPILLSCDAIYLLSNWRDSKGALLEHHIASELGMDVFWQSDKGTNA